MTLPLYRALDEHKETITAQRRKVRKLTAALLAFVEDATDTARCSFTKYDGKRITFNDDIWRKADPHGFALVEKARAALK